MPRAIIENDSKVESMAKMISQMKQILEEEKTKNGCKPTFGGHGMNCRCFTIYLKMKELEGTISKGDYQGYNQAILNAKEYVDAYIRSSDWKN